MTMPQNQLLDDLNLELDAMLTIARALAGLKDPDTRLRVLRWTNERFTTVPAAPAAPAATRRAEAPRNANGDPTLSVDGLHFFEDESRAETPVDALVNAPAAAVSDQPLDSLVRGFATDIRALALQWQSA
jgi:hypothetical protein